MFKFSRSCSAHLKPSQIAVATYSILSSTHSSNLFSTRSISLAPKLSLILPLSILVASLPAIAADEVSALPITTQSQTQSIANQSETLNNREAVTVPNALNPISIEASRIERKETIDITNQNNLISLTNQKEISETISRDLKQILRFEPGVNVSRTAVRPRSAAVNAGFGGGNSAIEMRGLTGDRVLVMVDDIPLPVNYAFGVLSMGPGNFAQSSYIKNVVSLRGSAVTPYGSDALVGGLLINTLEPSDLLKDLQKKTYFSITPSYNSADRSFGAAVQMAAQNENISGLIIANYQQGHETSTRGSQAGEGAKRTQADPLQNKNRSVLGKLNIQVSSNHQLTLTGERQEQRSNGNILSAKGPSGTGYNIDSLTTKDEFDISRISLTHRYQKSLPDNDENNLSLIPNQAKNQIYFRHIKLNQNIDELAIPTNRSRSRLGQYNDYSFGGSSRLTSELTHTVGSQPIKHQLNYGLSFDLSRVNPLQTNISQNTKTDQKTTPNARYIKYAAYLQDEINIAKFSILPGIRFDAYHAKPFSHPNYKGSLDTNSGYGFSPHLTLAYQLNPLANVYVQYAQGYRAPSPQELYFYYSAAYAPGRGYVNTGNPKLKAETSNSIETGIRGKIMRENLLDVVPALEYSVSIFAGKYKNFIENRMVERREGIQYFQNINLHQVNLYGVEGKLGWQINDSLKFNSALAWTHGRGKDNANAAETPIASVSPLTAVAGLRYEVNNKWHVRSNLTYRARKSRKDMPVDTTGRGEDFAPPSSTLLDIGAGYRINRFAMLNIGVDNLLNQKYWQWSDVRGLNLNRSPIIDAYSAPGRTYAASLKFEF